MAAPRHIRSLPSAGLLLGLLLVPLAGVAQPVPTDSTGGDTTEVKWEQSLPPLTVTAGRLPTPPAQAPARIEVIDSTALARTGAASVASALEARAGLHVRRYGEGGLATPALRGSGASQTALLLDGQRISNPQLGHLDLSLLPTVLLQSIEVMHGPASPVHGSDGLGGAIHLHTRQPSSSAQLRGTARAGAFGERGGSALGSIPLSDQTTVLAAAEHRATDGDFPYYDEGRYPPQTVRRRNADHARTSIYGSLRSQVGEHRVRLSGWGTHAERGLPPSSSAGSARERQWDTHLRLWGRDRMPVRRGVLTIDGMTQHTRLRYANPDQDLDQTGRTWIHSLESSLDVPLTEKWTAAAGLSGSAARARHPRLRAAAHQEHIAAFAEGTGTHGRLHLYPAVRTDLYWMSDGAQRTAVSPRLGLNWRPVPEWSRIRVKGQVGRAFRLPTFNDRYWQPGGTPDLRPERSWGGDLGLWIGHPAGHAELTVFGHRRRQQIVWRPSEDGYWSPDNVGRVRALGLEASTSWDWTLFSTAALQSELTYTVTDARNRSDPDSPSYNEPVLYVPRDQLKAHSTLSWGPAALTIHARYTGRRPTSSDGRQFLDEYVIARTQFRFEHNIDGVQAAVSLEIENIFNTDYRTIGYRPMPPRHARVAIDLAL